MWNSFCAALITTLLFLSAAGTALADAPPADQAKKDAPPVDRLSTSDGQITCEGQVIKYRANCGFLVIKDDAGKPKAEMFFVAYEKQPIEDTARRPITFVFNGGPGAAAVWLHLGTAGPKRIAFDEEGNPPTPPYQLEDNSNTWLGATDLCFIDPVGTGFSRAAPGEDAKQFYGVQEDISSVGEFIRLYITRNNRWLSPKFLAGESYGTTRAAGLAGHLLEEEGISLNGIVLISSVLNFRTIEFGGSSELPYALYLPSYTAVAHHFKKLPADLQNADLAKTLLDVEQWAQHDYLDALTAGSALTADQRKSVAARLARYIGLSPDYVEKANLRVDPSAFRKQLLVDEKKLIGRFDARIAGYNPDALEENANYDPSLPPYLAAYTATFNDYCRRTLKFEDDRSYDVLTGRVQPWNFGRSGGGYLDVATNLQDAMMKSPHMKVMFCNGSADLATPYLAARYTIRQMALSDELRANITHNIYIGGHMIYHYHPSLMKLGDDVRAFIRKSTPELPPVAATQPATVPTTQPK